MVVQGTEKIFKPSDDVVIAVVRTRHSLQSPNLTPALHPGELTTAVEVFASASAMWQAHQMLAVHKNPRVNVEKCFSPSLGAT